MPSIVTPAAPVTSEIVSVDTEVDAVTVVNAPVLAEAAPMFVPSIEPPSMSTLVSVAAPEVLIVVNAPVLAEAAPIAVPSIAPPSISALLIATEPVP